MSIFPWRNGRHLIPLHRDNARTKDWLIMLEANTIVGPERQSFRVAWATQEREVVRPLTSLWPQLFLVVEGYDPRIHVLFFCPQLYKYGRDGALVPLRGEEIGDFIAHAVADKAAQRRPWYDPMEGVPNRPLVAATMLDEFDTLLVQAPALAPLLPAPVQSPARERDREMTLGS